MILVKFSLKRLLNSNVHLSISTRRWNNYVKRFVAYKYRNFYFMDLMQTMFNLKLASFFISNLVKNRGTVVFVDKRQEFFVLLKYLKMETNQEYIGKHWVSGSFTNFSEFILKKNRNNSILEKSGLYNLSRLPDISIFLSLYENLNAVNEARALGLPSISIVGSDMNPSGINFILPGNDITKISVYLFAQIFKFSILRGYKMEKLLFYFLLKRFCYLFFLKQLLLLNK